MESENDSMMQFLSIYYEPKFNDAYFSENLRRLSKTFNVKKLKLNKIEDARKMVLNESSSWPRVILINNYINPNSGNKLCLDGIGLRRNNIAIVKYQSSLMETIYVLGHELAHLTGIEHCNSERCIMGTSLRTGRIHYSWWDIPHNKKFSKNLFCERCRSKLNY
jgi:hypothetical protein